MFMFNFAHAGHDHTEEIGTVQAATTQIDNPNYALYIGVAVGVIIAVICIAFVVHSFRKKITG